MQSDFRTKARELIEGVYEPLHTAHIVNIVFAGALLYGVYLSAYLIIQLACAKIRKRQLVMQDLLGWSLDPEMQGSPD